MSHAISISDCGRYLICRVSKPITIETALAFSMALDAASRAHGIKRFLVDVRNAPNLANTVQNYHFANTDMAALDLQRDVRSAMLVAPWDHSHDFVETFTQNAGYGVRLFRDEAAAIAWLEAPVPWPPHMRAGGVIAPSYRPATGNRRPFSWDFPALESIVAARSPLAFMFL